ncbi:MAG TPA: endonuclease/exonuclease/phosphatase family protein [Candidatus Saccharimonadales bacterium]|nr:endonuclease/exonuclease/phosphatase family protein [Candidatus Saccharimonadales bacterium]
MAIRIATYNLFEGANGSRNRLVEFVRTAELDVICLQEVNGWQDNDFARLKDFTDQVLFTSYAYGNSNTEYKLATASKNAISSRELHAEAFWHGAIETVLKIGGKEISIFNAHLDPWKEDSRAREMARLIAAVKPGRPTIITGDFNSLSRQDNYPPDLLTQLQSKGISKFGAQQLEFSVIDELLQAGFVDVAAALGKFDTTVPSDFNTDQAHEVPVRVDYMFVTPDLVPFVTEVNCIKTDLTNAISDHYPLVVTFNFDESAAAQTAATPVVQTPQMMATSAAAAAAAAGQMPAMPLLSPQPQAAPDEPAGGLPYAMPATPHAMWQPEPNAEEHSGLEEIKPEEPTQPEGQPAAEPPKPPVKPWVPEDEPSTPGEKDGAQAQPSSESPQQKPDDGESVSWPHEQ